MDMEGNLLAQFSEKPPRMLPEGCSPYVPHYPYDTAYLFEEQEDIAAAFFDRRYEGSGMKVLAGFSSFWLVKGDNKEQLQMVDYSPQGAEMNRFFSNYFYSMWSHRVSTGKHAYCLFGSPQYAGCVFYCEDAVFWGNVISLGILNSFVVNGEVIGDKESWQMALNVMDDLTDRFLDKIALGRTRQQAYVETFIPYYYNESEGDVISFENDMEKWLEFQCSQTESGKTLYEAVKEETFAEDDYKNYMDDCYREPGKHSIFERLLLRTFIGAPNQ